MCVMVRVKFSLKVPNRLQRITGNKKTETFVETLMSSKAVNHSFVSPTLPFLCRVRSGGWGVRNEPLGQTSGCRSGGRQTRSPLNQLITNDITGCGPERPN